MQYAIKPTQEKSYESPVKYDELEMSKIEEKLNAELAQINENLQTHRCFLNGSFTERRKSTQKNIFKTPARSLENTKSTAFIYFARSANIRSSKKFQKFDFKGRSEDRANRFYNNATYFSKFLNPSVKMYKNSPSSINTGRVKTDCTFTSLDKSPSNAELDKNFSKISIRSVHASSTKSLNLSNIKHENGELRNRINLLYAKISDLIKERENLIHNHNLQKVFF